MTADEIAREAMHIGAAQKHGEFAPFVAYIQDLRPKVVVEIGTMAGGTLRAWCACADDNALIVSIDLPGGEWGGGYTDADVPRLEGYAERGQRMELIRGDSHTVEVQRSLRAVLHRKPVDFLFIDGDHSYEGVRQDFWDYAPLVKPGGVIAFHDVIEHTQVPACRVSDLWAEIKASGKHETREWCVEGEYRAWGPWGGIGALTWEG